MGTSDTALVGNMRRRVLLLSTASLATIPLRARSEPPPSIPALSTRLRKLELMAPSAALESVPGELRYPAWLSGTWRVTNTNAEPAISLPLGSKFVDPNLIAEAKKASSRRYLSQYVDGTAAGACGQPVVGLPVRQDRRFNTMQEENAFIKSGGFVVEQATYTCDAIHPHGSVLLQILDTDATAAVRTPDASSSSSAYEMIQKTAFRSRSELDVVWAAWEAAADDASFITSEMTVQREVLPTGEELATSYLELLTKFERPPAVEQPATVRARYRIVQYLSFPDLRSPTRSRMERALEREAAGRAVAVLDYDLVMERVAQAGTSSHF